MKPVDQEHISYEDGDCLRACIASVLEFPLTAVPAYLDDDMGNLYADWLKQFNLTLMTIRLEPGGTVPDGYHLIEGPSSNGKDRHVAVGLNGKIVHDPDPTSRARGDAFQGDRHYWIFVAVNPADVVKG